MKNALFVGHFFLILLMIAPKADAAANSKSPYPPSALAGKWEGTPPAGGELEMTLQVSGDKITGNGLISTGKFRDPHPHISGEIKGKNIAIETYFPSTQQTVKYRCIWAEEDLLQCKAGAFKTEFKRRQN
jgi:hypothetical protein